MTAQSVCDDRVLVMGAGIAGINVAASLAEMGASVLLVEKDPWIGGRVMRMARYFPKMCPPSCGMEIHGRRLFGNPNIEVRLNTAVTGATRVGDLWTVELSSAPAFVSRACTGCKTCTTVCPVKVKNPFNLDKSEMPAIGFAHFAVNPCRPILRREACAPDCSLCADACPSRAIALDAQPVTTTVTCKVVVVATGWQPYDMKQLGLYGAGKLPNVIANVLMERLASLDGPTGGRIVTADGRVPKKVVFVQCAGSRDRAHLPYCSSVCCAASIKQARYVKEQIPDAEVTICYIDRRTPGRNEELLTAALADGICRFVKGKVGKIEWVDLGSGSGDERPNGLRLRVEDAEQCKVMDLEADLVVLALGMVPSVTYAGLELFQDECGFVHSDVNTGLIAAGCATAPDDVVVSIRDAIGAAVDALICKGNM